MHFLIIKFILTFNLKKKTNNQNLNEMYLIKLDFKINQISTFKDAEF